MPMTCMIFLWRMRDYRCSSPELARHHKILKRLETGVMAGAADDDARWMRQALQLAREGEKTPGANPIGCVIVLNEEVIGQGYNEVAMEHDATAHAEIVAMRRAGATLSCEEMRGAVLYTTLQPCGMCTMASIWAKIGRIVYGAGRGDVHDMYFEDRHFSTENFIRDAFKDDISLEGGVLRQECAALYVPPGAKVPEDQQFNR
jgi:tRNA(adenine34) deaminase